MFQDLMCLVFGRPCLSRIVSIKREDDQPYLTDGDPRQTWREVYEPDFGRSIDGVKPLDRGRDRPLFYLKRHRPGLAGKVDRSVGSLVAPHVDRGHHDVPARNDRRVEAPSGRRRT
jgi:hypothetical protein